jgi:pyridoxine 4-dehydrogenase
MPTLVGKEVGPIGYGLMGLTWRAQPPPIDQAFKAMTAALNNGANFWNGGEIYGSPTRNSCHVLNEYFKQNPGAAEKVVLSIKGGSKKGEIAPDGSEENIRRSVEDCLEVLNGTIGIDIFECARVDPNTPIEDTIGYLKKFVEEGKIGGIGLSEVSAKTIRRAHKVHPIAAVEGELSLWAIGNLENDVIATCGELGIPFVAYSPLGGGVLTGTIKTYDDIPKDSFVGQLPKYRPDVLDKNLQLVHKVEEIAKRKNCTLAQLSVAWVRHLNGKPGMPVIIPIPGATTEDRVNENSKEVSITDEEAKEMDDILQVHAVRGMRAGRGAHLMEG